MKLGGVGAGRFSERFGDGGSVAREAGAGGGDVAVEWTGALEVARAGIGGIGIWEETGPPVFEVGSFKFGAGSGAGRFSVKSATSSARAAAISGGISFGLPRVAGSLTRE